MTGFDRDDVTAMHKQGDLKAFMRSLIQPTRKPEQRPPKPARKPPDRQPGAWPAGTHPPSAPKPLPGADWQTALAEYREWAATHDHTDDDAHRYRCDCGACPTARARGAPA